MAIKRTIKRAVKNFKEGLGVAADAAYREYSKIPKLRGANMPTDTEFDSMIKKLNSVPSGARDAAKMKRDIIENGWKI
jgi:hypothetical protein